MGWGLNFVLVASTLVLAYSGTIVTGFKDDPPSFNFATLPETTFSCNGRVSGRYYADNELECQVFHVCVRESANSVQDFKFICPNGTTFDQEHQVCMDYYEVVCHEDVGTNPYGNIYELMKLSSNPRSKTYDLESGKISFINPDVQDRNNLGDDFQVDEHNNNPLAASQNSLNFQNTKKSRRPAEDIFYKTFASTKYTYQPTTATTTTTTSRPVTRPSTTSTTAAAPLVFRGPISTSSAPSTKRKPNLETYESYEIESVAGLTQQNSFNRLSTADQSYKHYDYSYETQDPEPSSTSSTKTSTTTTHKPLVFHNTFRSPFPASSSTAIPPVQTFQQQASRFNEDFFRKLPSSTETSVSKAAQFYLNSNIKYSTPEFKHPTTNPFSRSTTEIPFSRERQDNRFPAAREPVSSQNDRGLTNRGSVTFENSGLNTSPRRQASQVAEYEQTKTNQARPHSEEDVIRPRSFSGTTNVNQVSNNRQNHRDNFGSSPVPPPTTAEPRISTLSPVNSFQKITTSKPDKYAIFYSQSTTSAHKDYSVTEPKRVSSSTTAKYYEPSTTSTYRPVSSTSLSHRQVDLGQKAELTPSRSNSRANILITQRSTTQQQPVPETTTTTTTLRPRQRGTRRRVQRPRQQLNVRKFDPELKYSRRIEPTQDSKADEIFDAEASVFPGRPVTNLFNEEVSKKAQVPSKSSSGTEEPQKLAENYGRKIKVQSNTIRRQYVTPRTEQPEVSSTSVRPTESSTTHDTRRLVKLKKLKTTTGYYDASTTEIPTTTTDYNSTPYPTTTNEPFYVSTLRPVKRIQVKTKIGTRTYEKNSEFRVPPEIGSVSAYDKLKKIAATSTTPEPELVTISDEEFLLKKLKKYTNANEQFTTPTTYKPLFNNQNSSTVVIRVTQKTQKSAIPTPISFKEPILPRKITTSRVEVQKSVQEEPTKSPDYDYAYYNSDDDYFDTASKLDTKNYGKKPVKKALPPLA